MFINGDSFVSDVYSKIDGLEKYLRHLPLSGRASYAKQGFEGESSIIAVLDSGVNPSHPELQGRVELLNYSGYGAGLDDNGHGTHVAATIAGKTVGIAPKTKIISVKVLDAVGGGDFNNIIKACEDMKKYRAKDGRKLTAVSMSLSAPAVFFQGDMLERFRKAIRGLTDEGIAVICSAGNTGKMEIRFPAFFSEPITVGAVDAENLKPAGFSTESREVDVSQIGIDILSAWYQGGYRVMSGTSMATPIVAGISALIADKFYQVFKEQIPETVLYWMLKMNTKDIGIKGLCTKTGAGFCSLQPIPMNLYTRVGQPYMTNEITKIPLRAEVTVIPPGVTSLPAREFVEDCFGGLVEWNPETLFARFRV